MASKARKAFDANAKDIKRLLDLHEQIGGGGPGRRYGLEVLNKSAIVLITAYWEAYCEDIASEALEHLVRHAKTADALPKELKKLIAKKAKGAQHDLEIWKLADEGWRGYLRGHLSELKAERDRRLNTPKSKEINELFRNAVGIDAISEYWRWPKGMTPPRASAKLDKYVTLRGAIAHRGKYETSVTRANVVDYFDFMRLLVSRTGGRVNIHVKGACGVPLW